MKKEAEVSEAVLESQAENLKLRWQVEKHRQSRFEAERQCLSRVTVQAAIRSVAGSFEDSWISCAVHI